MKMSSQRLHDELKAFLFGVTMEIPLLRNEGYDSATSWLLVLSMTMDFPGALIRYSRISSGVRIGWVDFSRSCFQVLKDRLWSNEETKRHFLLLETRARERYGHVFVRLASWSRKTAPTPPTPGHDAS